MRCHSEFDQDRTGSKTPWPLLLYDVRGVFSLSCLDVSFSFHSDSIEIHVITHFCMISILFRTYWIHCEITLLEWTKRKISENTKNIPTHNFESVIALTSVSLFLCRESNAAERVRTIDGGTISSHRHYSTSNGSADGESGRNTNVKWKEMKIKSIHVQHHACVFHSIFSNSTENFVQKLVHETFSLDIDEWVIWYWD